MKFLRRRLAITAPLLLAFLTNADASSSIKCLSPNGSPITIRIESSKYQNEILNCIDGDFIYDLTPCAPNGKYALSRPTGSVDIVEVTESDKVMFNWNGGYTQSIVNSDEIFFGGGFYASETWYFKVDRETGIGTLRLWKSEEPAEETETKYECHKVKSKL